MIVEKWTELFRRQWEADLRQPLTLEILNALLHEASRIQGTANVTKRDGKPFKLLSIYVHFIQGIIIRVDELEKTAVALIHRRGARTGRTARIVRADAGDGRFA
jgi:hypothetical protein